MKPKFKPIPEDISKYAKKHGHNREALLDIFQEHQDNQGALTKDAIADIAHSLKIPEAHAYGVASFYSMLDIQDDIKPSKKENTLRICDGPVCWLFGSTNVHKAAQSEYAEKWKIERSSCLGLCNHAPAAIDDQNQYGPLSDDKIPEIKQGKHRIASDFSTPRPGEIRVMLKNAGKIDPASINSALSFGAYKTLEKVLKQHPDEIISQVENSGLSGRGGAGFPTGRKWRFVSQAEKSPKYIICNADESEPLIFKDRILIENNPHQILEGMAIAGYATGAEQAFIYIRGEYLNQAETLKQAIRQAEDKGLLGKNILGSNFSFTVHIHKGAGAYICGEETALIESLEGNRGEPRIRPPYPPSYGYKGYPTLVNNVETYASVPAISFNGPDWYHSLSSYSTPGTKLYMVLGHINNPGLFEAPFGLTLRDIIDEYGQGMQPGSSFNFALTGGAAGTLVPASLLDIPIDYSSFNQGVSLGAGAMLIIDQSVTPLSLLRELLHFFKSESCGKCTPCRIGTHQSLQILNRMVNNKILPGDKEELLMLADLMQNASFCGLGQSVAVPVKSALTHFEKSFQ